jgi:hypothetical protein
MTKKALAAVTGKRQDLAKEIRELTKNVALNSIEMGKKLKTARATFPVVKGKGAIRSRPGWEEWSTKETGLSIDTINRLIKAAEQFHATPTGVSWKTGKAVLRLLVPKNVPQEAKKQIIDKLDKGEKVTEAEAKEIISRATKGGITKKEIEKISAFHADNAPPLPKPKEAKKEARDSGEFVLASDGYYYSPASDEAIEKHAKSLRLTCKVLRAVETLNTMEVTPHQFIDQAIFYMLWADNERAVRNAAKWLDALATSWETSADKIKQKVATMREERQQEKQRMLK